MTLEPSDLAVPMVVLRDSFACSSHRRRLNLHATEERDLILRNCRIVDVSMEIGGGGGCTATSPVLSDVVVRAGKITSISAADSMQHSDDAVVLDCSDMFLMPGQIPDAATKRPHALMQPHRPLRRPRALHGCVRRPPCLVLDARVVRREQARH